jgi:rhamnosyltransferase
MKRQEDACHGKPIIVYTDLYVTDAALNITCNSFWQEICLHPEFITTFDEMAASTAVTGCAMLFNRQVRDCVVLPATHATMHDAWITACTLRKNGKIFPIFQQLVYYRQHEDNCVGSDDLNHIDLAYRIRNFRTMQRKNWQLYRMLRSLGYGSIVKFFYYKWKYKQRIQHKAGL